MTRPRLAAALFVLMLAGSLAWTISRQGLRPLPPSPFAGGHRALQRFATDVERRTAPGTSIYFMLPNDFADGGLINHRLRYLLPLRVVSTDLDRFSPPPAHIDYVAPWRNGSGTLEAAR